jgi:3-phenylpropionate/trans-cinnamate dioxygenase ferredoxin subunit
VNSSAPDGFVQVQGLVPAQVEDGQLYAAALPNGTRLCVGRHDGTWFATKDSCPHSEFPLSEGTLYPNGELECSWHGARFHCLSGAVLRGPAEDPLVRFDVQVIDGALWVKRVAGVTASGGGR